MTDLASTARDVVELARLGVPFAEARSMSDEERRAYLDVFAAEEAEPTWTSGLPTEEPEPEAVIPGASMIG